MTAEFVEFNKLALESLIFNISISSVSWGRLVPLVFCFFITWAIISSLRYLHEHGETTHTTDKGIRWLTVGGCLLTILLAFSVFSGFNKRAMCIQNFKEHDYSSVEGPISNYKVEGKFPEYYQSFSVAGVAFQVGKFPSPCGFTEAAFDIGAVRNGTYVRILHNHGAIYSFTTRLGP